MKRTKQTALTAAVFAAAIGISSAGSTASAASIGFSPESQQTAAVLYGPPPVQIIKGDVNSDRVIDARDLTLMKRILTEDPDSHTEAFNFYQDSSFDVSDVRVLAQHLTGEYYSAQKRPVELRVYFWLVPYFEDEAPETDEAQLKLVQEAKLRLERLRLDKMDSREIWPEIKLSAAAEAPHTAFDWQRHGPVFQSSFGAEYDYSFDYYALPYYFAPNEFGDEALPDAEYLSLQRAEISVTVPFEADFDPESADDQPVVPLTKGYNGSFLTYIQRADGSEEYYDKILIEWNVNTGEIRIYDSLTPEQSIPEWEFPG